MSRYTIDAPRTQLRIRTKAEGVFSPLAHDLELEFPIADDGEATADGTRWTAKLVAHVDDVRVVGVIKRGALNERTLSPADRATIEKKIRDEVFEGVHEITVDASGDGPRGRATLKLGAGEAGVDVVIDSRDAQAVVASTAVTLSSLGLSEVRGPMNAFRVGDRVTVQVRAVLVDAGG